MKPSHKKIPGKKGLFVVKIFKEVLLIIPFLLLFSLCNSQTIKSKQSSDSLQSKAWNVIGPGGGGGILLPTISPFDENFVLTHCNMTGAYVTYNGGVDWRMFNLWTVPNEGMVVIQKFSFTCVLNIDY